MDALAVYEVHVTLSREDHVIVYPNGSVYSSLREYSISWELRVGLLFDDPCKRDTSSSVVGRGYRKSWT